LPEAILELRNARLVRGETQVLHGVTLTVHRGEHTAIVGPNGAGKSSLIRLLTRDSYPIVDWDEPAVRLFGRDRWDVSALRARLGIVSADVQEQFVRDPWVARQCGLDVVLSGLLSSRGVFRHHTVTDTMRGQAHAALEDVGVSHLATRRFDTLSTGEARRVLIARACIAEPELLVLDEPTTGLDVVARHRFMERIRRVAREGATLVVVTQHIDEIVPEIERVVLLSAGRVAADGRKADVLTPEPLGAVFGAPVMVTVSGDYYYVRPR